MGGTGRLVMSGVTARIADAHLYGVLFAGAVAAFCLNKVVGSQLGAASQLLAIIGDATCGWSWLLVRALFRRPDAQRTAWPLAVVGAMVALGAVLRLTDGPPAPLWRMASNAEGLTSSALLLLATIEPLKGIGGNVPLSEKRFRTGFAASYAAILAIAVLLVDGAPAGSAAARFGGGIKAACALVALAGMGFAIWYRTSNPVPRPTRPRRRSQAGDDSGLGERILHLMQREAAFAQPDLKVADLARIAGEAEYKITQCVTGALGFRNFNHMANHFRVAEAKRRLADRRLDHLPILTIALDCGFGSIGPFNRAFKAEAGTTPMHFRKTCQADDCQPTR